MVSVNHLSVYFGSYALFNDISFVISARERIALVGKNGVGKSTLLKLLAGLESPSEGCIAIPNDLSIGYLPQVMQHQDGLSVYQECEQVFAHITALEQEVDQLAQEMAERTDYDSAEYTDLIARYSQRSDALSMVTGGSYHAQIERTLLGLGFERSDFHRQTTEFSGGWRMRIELAKILLRRPDLLLLDEPTNHLDIESIRWLENFLGSSSSAMIVISHDKAFVDATTSRTLEIELGKLYDYRTNYSHYLQLREERLEQQRRAYENQQKAIQETEDFIERFRYKATKAVQVQSRIKQLEKIERIELDEQDRRAMHFSFTPAQASGQYPIVITSLTKAYGNHVVLRHVDMTIKRGEKVALVGKNGAGKSTLVKCIMGQITDYEGTIQLGHNVEIGYFAQTQAEQLDPMLSIFETIDREAKGEIRLRINDILGAFMFGGELSEKKVGVLSGGERGRVALIKLLLNPANVLILDEPTNHLDIHSKEVLKEAIRRFEGTVIIVSHDRDFLDGLVERLYECRDGQVREYMGSVHEWLYKRTTEESDLRVDSTSTATNNLPKANTDYEKQKEEQKRRRNQERELRQLEDRSEQIDTELQTIERELSQTATPAPEFYARYESLQTEQTMLLKRWEELSEALA